jgi:hypothetical protein
MKTKIKEIKKEVSKEEIRLYKIYCLLFIVALLTPKIVNIIKAVF